jgi:peptide subunit release factor RF-3
MDEEPDPQTVYEDLAKETSRGLGVPVLFGSALRGFGVRRLLKAIRTRTPAPRRRRSGCWRKAKRRSCSRPAMAGRWAGWRWRASSAAR